MFVWRRGWIFIEVGLRECQVISSACTLERSVEGGEKEVRL